MWNFRIASHKWRTCVPGFLLWNWYGHNDIWEFLWIFCWLVFPLRQWANLYLSSEPCPQQFWMSKCCLDLVKTTCCSCVLDIMILDLKSAFVVLLSCFFLQFKNRKHILTFSNVINMPLLNLVITPTWENFVNVGKNFHLSWHNAFFPLLKYWNS